MSPEDSLPVVLISAADANSAATVISQLADDENSLEENNADSSSRVWKLVNKYYTARLRLQPQLDSEQVDLEHIDAHVIYLTEPECKSEEAVSCLERRAARARGAGEVLLALCECDAPGEGEGEGESESEGEGAAERLEAASRRLRYEFVPLRERAPSDVDADTDQEDQPFPELYGVSRARAALHAHAWPGVAVSVAGAGAGAVGVAGEEGEGEGEDEDSEEAAVGRAEMFAEALQQLGALDAEERRDRAEVIVDVFCRALGLRADLL